MSFRLRPYQQQAVKATVEHFRQSDDAAVIVLPTGAGKSLVIAELARLARRKILVLAHVKELVEQNHAKYQAYGLSAGVFSAGLNQKNSQSQVTFASVQSVARNLSQFDSEHSLLIIDECHRVAEDNGGQYGQIITHLKRRNPTPKVLGLTATPFRLGSGWIYQQHYHGFVRSHEPRPFVRCIFELPLTVMIKSGYLTPPKLVDAPIAQYDFSALSSNAAGHYATDEVNALLVRHPRVTQSIVEQVVALAQRRGGCMIFAATLKHAEEIYGYLSALGQSSALVTGNTPGPERDALITAFKNKQVKFLVNVSVLTTGFDAPHVDLIAILRPTQSVSLYQQIVGRGLRLADGKQDCLIIDYAGNGISIMHPEVGSKKPHPDSEPVQVLCPACGFANIFWGKRTEDGQVLEHYGRRCQGLLEDDEGNRTACDFRYKFKTCPQCGAENDIAGRICHQCNGALIDPDEQLKSALKLKDALVLRCQGMALSADKERLRLTYVDEDGTELTERFDLGAPAQRHRFIQLFGRRANGGKGLPDGFCAAMLVAHPEQLKAPDFVVARKAKYGWRIQQRLFDYQGAFRLANQL